MYQNVANQFLIRVNLHSENLECARMHPTWLLLPKYAYLILKFTDDVEGRKQPAIQKI